MATTLRGAIRSAFVSGIMISVLTAQGREVRAALLNLTLQYPDIHVSFVQVDYDATDTVGHFVAAGFADQLALSRTQAFNIGFRDLNYRFDLYLDKDTGQLLPGGGGLTVTGTVAAMGLSGTLLTGAIDDFGFESGGGQIFEFLFNVTGGALASRYGGRGGIIMDFGPSGNFSGSFGESFSNYGDGNDDAGSTVPEPTSIVAVASLALAGLFARLRPRRRNVSAV